MILITCVIPFELLLAVTARQPLFFSLCLFSPVMCQVENHNYFVNCHRIQSDLGLKTKILDIPHRLLRQMDYRSCRL